LDAAQELSLCQRYAGRIRAYGLSHLRDRPAAEDLVQTVLLSVLVALRDGRVEDPTRLDAYVLGTCRNAAMDLRRGERRRERLAERASSGLPEGYQPTYATVDQRKLEQCVGALEARARAVVLATFLEEREAEEIARAMQLTVGNVRVIRHRALARLQACIEGRAA
jgi:RNA polymerase sigma-70 factor (ECF subfamily)